MESEIFKIVASARLVVMVLATIAIFRKYNTLPSESSLWGIEFEDIKKMMLYSAVLIPLIMGSTIYQQDFLLKFMGSI